MGQLPSKLVPKIITDRTLLSTISLTLYEKINFLTCNVLYPRLFALCNCPFYLPRISNEKLCSCMVQTMPTTLPIPFEQRSRLFPLCVARTLSLDPSVSWH
jgi:hypothetical protein